jgi:hypothetical protein
VLIQRSCGYSWRPSLSVARIGRLVERVKALQPACVCFVDNCYGELVEDQEPTAVGADLMAGSLIKNLGGTIAPSGGYVAGRADLVEQACCRLTAPGIGSEGGSSFDLNRLLFQGLFLAPPETPRRGRLAVALDGIAFMPNTKEGLGLRYTTGGCTVAELMRHYTSKFWDERINLNLKQHVNFVEKKDDVNKLYEHFGQRLTRTPGEDFRLALCHKHRVFEVRGRFAIFGDDCPSVFKNAHSADTGVDHRLDGKSHAWYEHGSFSLRAVIWNLRLFVKAATDAVANEFAHDGEAARDNKCLHRTAKVGESAAGARVGDRFEK